MDDEEELKEFAQTLSQYCMQHQDCKGCIFFREVRFLHSSVSHCAIDCFPDCWEVFDDN